MYRQGDVLIIPVSEVPNDVEEVPREDGRTVLARGEATGHAHAINSRFAHLVAKGAERYLRAERPVMLRHEEHSKIHLPAGQYRVIIQREYHPESVRNVLD